ncbi:hypothetical protein [Frigidibacter mobilis]|uniref:Nickel/cobalt transporter regulator n=1 Tax=Frigidibacter mobilis TaxID=1335048 RepID=A0A159YYH6_9RHOB|nr:hypothetical protein [Frigidibacter mobilis]AMY67367.1 hypothetical protein AKL17_0105 [Frigidibacter mobilis]
MKRLAIFATAAATMLGSATAIHAQPHSNDACRPGESRCLPQQGQKSQPGKGSPELGSDRSAAPRPGETPATRVAAPQAGDSGKGGRPYQRARDSRFREPPRGQEYRVVNDHLVLVDSRTSKVVTVLGLLDTLLK